MIPLLSSLNIPQSEPKELNSFPIIFGHYVLISFSQIISERIITISPLTGFTYYYNNNYHLMDSMCHHSVLKVIVRIT